VEGVAVVWPDGFDGTGPCGVERHAGFAVVGHDAEGRFEVAADRERYACRSAGHVST
jgi:hypothetical protein